MRSPLILLLLAFILLAPSSSAFPIGGGVIIEQGNAQFQLDELITVDLDQLRFATDGAPIFDGLTLGYASASASYWTIQHVGDGLIVLNATTSAAGTMRFAGWSAYQISGVVGLRPFEREDAASWNVPEGEQTISLRKVPTLADRTTAAMISGVTIALVSLLLVSGFGGLFVLANRKRS